MRLAAELAAMDRLMSERRADDRAALNQHIVDDERTQDDLHRDIGHVHDTLPTLLPRSEYASHHAQLEERIGAVAARVDRMEGARSGSGDTVARFLAAVAALAAVASVIVVLAH